MVKIFKRVLKLLLFAGAVAAVAGAVFFGIKYTEEVEKREVADERLAELEEWVAGLELDNETLTSERDDFKAKMEKWILKYFEVKESRDKLSVRYLTALLENTSLRNKFEKLEKEIEAINSPPVSPDASTPWERLQTSLELLRSGEYGAYWEMVNSEFRENCPKEKFVAILEKRLGAIPAAEDIIFIDQAEGHSHAVVWALVKGRLASQDFIKENGQWHLVLLVLFGC